MRGSGWVVLVAVGLAVLTATTPLLGLLSAREGPRPSAAGTAFLASDWKAYPGPMPYPDAYGVGEASDPVDHSVIDFGGCAPLDCTSTSNATWSEAEGVWTELHPSTAPSPRGDVQMAWDPADGYVLLFGGVGCRDPPACDLNGPLNDTWAFKHGTWNPVVPSGPSPPLTGLGGLAYDPSDREMILFGGSGCTLTCGTWAYSGGTWVALNLTAQPSPRSGAGFSEDDADHGALLFGGQSPAGSDLDDTWLFSAGAWQNLTSEQGPTPLPLPRTQPAMAWDPGIHSVVFVAGVQAGPGGLRLNDTWEFQNGTWSSWGVAENTVPNRGAGLAEDPTTGLLVLFGGCSYDPSGVPACGPTSPWAFGPVYTVGEELSNGTCASARLDGLTTDASAPWSVQNGTHDLVVTACPGDQIVNVTATAPSVTNSTRQNASGWNGTLTVAGAGVVLVNLTVTASNPPPTGLAAISVLGLTFLELLLILIALAAMVGVVVSLQVTARKKGGRRFRDRPKLAKPPPEF